MTDLIKNIIFYSSLILNIILIYLLVSHRNDIKYTDRSKEIKLLELSLDTLQKENIKLSFLIVNSEKNYNDSKKNTDFWMNKYYKERITPEQILTLKNLTFNLNITDSTRLSIYNKYLEQWNLK